MSKNMFKDFYNDLPKGLVVTVNRIKDGILISSREKITEYPNLRIIMNLGYINEK